MSGVKGKSGRKKSKNARICRISFRLNEEEKKSLVEMMPEGYEGSLSLLARELVLAYIKKNLPNARRKKRLKKQFAELKKRKEKEKEEGEAGRAVKKGKPKKAEVQGD